MLSTLKCLGAFLLYIHVHAFMSKSDFKEICEVAYDPGYRIFHP